MSVLYQDETVCVTDLAVIIRKYYFPFKNQKYIKYDEIQEIHIRVDMQGKQAWGMDKRDETKWFSKDQQRENKPKYIELKLKQQETKPCFSPQNCQAIFKLIKSQMQKLKQSKQAYNNQGHIQNSSINKKKEDEEKNFLKEIPQLKTNAEFNLFSA